MDYDLRDTLAQTPAPRWWTYKLSTPLERRFANETDAARNHQLRFWIAIGLAFSWLNLVVDLITIPDVWRLIVSLRLFVVTPVSLLAIKLLGRSQARWLEALSSVAPPAAALLAVLLGFAASATVDPFRSAIVLSIGILWMNILMPMRFGDAMVFTLVTLTSGNSINIIATLRAHATFDYPEVIVTTHVLVALSLLARFIAERESRRNFLLGLRLQIRADDLTRSNAKLLEMSNTDPLTGLANRRFFDLTLATAWQKAAASGAWLAIMMIDVDHFKLFNDAAGHLEGDRCLIVIARAIADQMRPGVDFAARFGGEEFIVMMAATEGVEAQKMAERVRTAIAALKVFHPGRIGRGLVSVSIGVAAAECAEANWNSTTLLAAADKALYAAKAAGRDRVIEAEAHRR